MSYWTERLEEEGERSLAERLRSALPSHAQQIVTERKTAVRDELQTLLLKGWDTTTAENRRLSHLRRVEEILSGLCRSQVYP